MKEALDTSPKSHGLSSWEASGLRGGLSSQKPPTSFPIEEPPAAAVTVSEVWLQMCGQHPGKI